MKPAKLALKTLSNFSKFKVGRPTPIFASYNVTGKCNMKCMFCDWWKKDIPELSPREASRVIEKICGLGVSFLDLSGGEPLLRKDVVTLAKEASSLGCFVSMNTNGTLVKASTASTIADAFDVIVISLDGPPPIHDRIRGVEGTYERAMDAIRLLKNRKVRVGVNSVVTPWNIDVLPKFISDLRELVDFVQIQPIHPYPPSAQNRPSQSSLSTLSNFLRRLKRSDPGFLAVPEKFVTGLEPFFRGKIPKICHAGELYVAVDPMGRLLACPARADFVLGNVLSDSAQDVLRRRRSEGWSAVAGCKGCWLECTVGVSMILENPVKEAWHLFHHWFYA